MTTKVEINKENIQKALDFLKLDSNPFSNDSLLKGENDEEIKEEKDEEIEEDKEEKKDKVEEIKEDKEEIKEDKEEKDEEIEKSIEIGKKFDLLEKSITNKLEEATEELQKTKEINNELLKNNKILLEQIDKIQKSIDGGFDQNSKKFSAIGELENAQIKAIEDITKRITRIENTPLKKSITAQNYIEKGFDRQEESLKDGETLSLSKNRKDIVKILRTKSKIDEVDNLSKANGAYLTALQEYESSNQISKAIKEDLLKSEKIQIIS